MALKCLYLRRSSLCLLPTFESMLPCIWPEVVVVVVYIVCWQTKPIKLVHVIFEIPEVFFGDFV